jgi:hypothetical protein
MDSMAIEARPARAVILRRPGDIVPERQYAICARHADRHHYRIVSLTDREEDAVALVRLGEAEVVVTAFDTPRDDRLLFLVGEAGGRMEYCRPPRHRKLSLPGHNTDEIILRMLNNGGLIADVVRLLGVPLQRVRSVLTRQPRK